MPFNVSYPHGFQHNQSGGGVSQQQGSPQGNNTQSPASPFGLPGKHFEYTIKLVNRIEIAMQVYQM